MVVIGGSDNEVYGVSRRVDSRQSTVDMIKIIQKNLK